MYVCASMCMCVCVCSNLELVECVGGGGLLSLINN